jgi:hypothetical protein
MQNSEYGLSQKEILGPFNIATSETQAVYSCGQSISCEHSLGVHPNVVSTIEQHTFLVENFTKRKKLYNESVLKFEN